MILHALSVVMDEISEVDRYIICCTKEGDSLSQWSAYASNGSAAIFTEQAYINYTNIRISFKTLDLIGELP
jgi:hypothetical protein